MKNLIIFALFSLIPIAGISQISVQIGLNYHDLTDGKHLVSEFDHTGELRISAQGEFIPWLSATFDVSRIQFLPSSGAIASSGSQTAAAVGIRFMPVQQITRFELTPFIGTASGPVYRNFSGAGIHNDGVEAISGNDSELLGHARFETGVKFSFVGPFRYLISAGYSMTSGERQAKRSRFAGIGLIYEI